MTLTPVERRLEDAIVLYVKAQAWQASIGLFAELARIESDNANAWLGIGSALWRLSLDSPELLEPAVAALKRAVEENKQPLNKSPRQLLFNASQSATKAGIDAQAIKAFAGDPRYFAELVQFTPQTLIDTTRTLNENARAQIVSLLSEVPGEIVELLLTDLSEKDANNYVRTAASKALRERPQKPAAPVPAVGTSPESALDEVAAESADTPEPQVTVADAPAADVASTIPNVVEVIPNSTAEEVIVSNAKDTADDIPAVEAAAVETPEKPKPADDETIRAQLEARRQRLMGKK